MFTFYYLCDSELSHVSYPLSSREVILLIADFVDSLKLSLEDFISHSYSIFNAEKVTHRFLLCVIRRNEEGEDRLLHSVAIVFRVHTEIFFADREENDIFRSRRTSDGKLSPVESLVESPVESPSESVCLTIFQLMTVLVLI